MHPDEVKEKLLAAGVVGAGGAGFPTYGKLADGIDTVVVNAVECEPLLGTDLYLLRRHLSEVVDGAVRFAASMGAEVIMAVKRHNAELLGWLDGQPLAGGCRVAALPDVYPMGDELVMIYEATGRVVPPGALPSSVGVVVINAETAYNVHHALEGKPVTRKWLTIAGAVERAEVLCVPVGTPVAELLQRRGVAVPAGHVVIDGGPAMGRVINPSTAVVTKTTKGLLVLPEGISAVRTKLADPKRLAKRVPSACCQCSFCSDMCPRALLGYPLQPHRTLRAVSAGQVQGVETLLATSLCSGCGVCTYVACCQGVAPSAAMAEVKTALAQNRLRYTAEEPTQPDKLRAYRMVPSKRFAAMLGVKHFLREAEGDEDFVFDGKYYRLPLSQHLGAPSVPVVAAGERVSAGQLIAKAAQGLSTSLHAPVDGVVRAVTADMIEILTGGV